MWTGFIWLRIGTGGRLLWTFAFHKTLVISVVREQEDWWRDNWLRRLNAYRSEFQTVQLRALSVQQIQLLIQTPPIVTTKTWQYLWNAKGSQKYTTEIISLNSIIRIVFLGRDPVRSYIVRDITPSRPSKALVDSCPEDGGKMSFWNVGWLLTDYEALYSRGQNIS
jgi:hypothetical protein